jgi:gag-polyprotein putative aspartyl protease
MDRNNGCVTSLSSAARASYRFFIVVTCFLLLTRSACAETVELVREHGVYMVPVQINGAITLPFVLDSGASEVAIPADVFSTLLRTGTVDTKDFVGTGTYVMANGSSEPSDRYVLRTLSVGNHIVRDVVANVISVQGDPLLGQSFLSKLPAWTIDNERHALVLQDQISPSGHAPSVGTEPTIPLKAVTAFTGRCRFQLVVGFFPCDGKIIFSELNNGRATLAFFNGNNMFFLSGDKDRQANLENYYLSIDTFAIQLEGHDGQRADHGMEGECHFRMNKAATRFFEIKCDIYNRAKGTMYNFYLDKIRKIDRKAF